MSARALAAPAGGLGFTVVELLVAGTVGLVVLAALTALVGAGGRVLLGAGLRLETDDMVVSAFEAFAFDVRRAGWDPAAAGAQALVAAASDAITMEADLDGDGAIDPSSEERVRWACSSGPPRLSRIVGAQSMPAAGSVTACRFAFFDADGATLPSPPGGLDGAARAAVRAIRLDLAVRPPGLGTPTARHALVALRRMP